MSLQALRNLTDTKRLIELEEVVALSAEARSYAEEYKSLGVEAPDWVAQVSELLRNEIQIRTRAADLAALKSIDAELESLKTASERRNDAAARRAALQKKLGIATEEAVAK